MPFAVKQKMGNGAIHVFMATSVRVEGKTSPRQHRKYLGVLEGGELLLGKSVRDLSSDEAKALAAKGIAWNGRRAVSRKSLPEAPGTVPEQAFAAGKVLEYGRAVLLSELSSRLGLSKALELAFGHRDADLVLMSAIYEECTGDALCRLGEWVEDTWLAEQKTASSPSAITRLCSRLSSCEEERATFFREWFKANGHPRSLISDTTSISSYSEKLSILEWGHNRDREKMTQLNLDMVHARETELPLYYRELPGSVPDIVTITTTAGIISGLGLKDYSFALGRGFFSEENLWHFHDNRLGFTIGVPLDAHGTARRLLEHCRAKLHAFNSTISFGETTLDHTSAAYAFTRKNNDTGKKESFKATAHIYLNRIRQAEEERQFQELLSGVMRDFSRTDFPEMDEAEQWLAGRIGKSRLRIFALTGTAKPKGATPTRFVVSKDGGFRLSVREAEYARAVRDMGIFMILNSDDSADGERTLKDNRSRDLQEKVFDILKNTTGNDRVRVSGDDTLKGRLFLAFIAVILHKAVEKCLRAANMLKTTSVNKALDLARKFNAIGLPDGRRLPLEVPKKSRVIYEVIAPGLLKQHGVEPGDAAAVARKALAGEEA